MRTLSDANPIIVPILAMAAMLGKAGSIGTFQCKKTFIDEFLVRNKICATGEELLGGGL